MKGFITPEDNRSERNGACTDLSTTMAWAVANKPGATPVNGGRRRRESKKLSDVYRIFKQRQLKRHSHFHLGRHTNPKPRNRIENAEVEQAS